MILDLIEKNKDITQREISQSIGVAVSMVNSYLDEYEEKGYIKRNYRSTKTVEYFVTKKGSERKKVLNIGYLNDSLKVFKSASEAIVEFLYQVIAKGFKKIFLYGAGEVAEILLQTLAIDNEIPIDVLGVIDDDINKQNGTLINTQVLPVSVLDKTIHDGVLISSYTHKETIMSKLQIQNYDQNKILTFFEI